MHADDLALGTMYTLQTHLEELRYDNIARPSSYDIWVAGRTWASAMISFPVDSSFASTIPMPPAW